MRLLPLPHAICLALLSACTPTEPTDMGPSEIVPELVDEGQFATVAAETLCAQLFECECGDNPFTDASEPLPWASEAECVAEKKPDFQATLDAALATGGSYSAECGGEYIANFQRPYCQSYWDFRAGGGKLVDSQICPLVVHERAVGEECDPYAYFANDCGEGKLCTYENYTCVAIGELPVQAGGACEVGYVDLPCASGLVCTYIEGFRTCQAPPKLGDPCPDYSCFGADLSCDYDSMTCQANALEGESCEIKNCSAGLYCDGGQEFTCVAQYEFGHGCANDSVCADGGVCIDNLCSPPQPVVCGY